MTTLSPKARELMRQASRGGGPTDRQRQALKGAVMAAVLTPTVAGAATVNLVLAGVLAAAAGAGLTAGAVSVWRLAVRPPAPSAHVRTVVPPTAAGAASSTTPDDQRPTPVPPAPPAPPIAPAGEALSPHRAPGARETEPRRLDEVPAPTVQDEPAPLPHGFPGAAPGGGSAGSTPAPVPEVGSRSTGGAAGLPLEMEALDRAVRALDAERFDEGLAQAREFLRHFPRSELVTEARVVEVLALCGLERVDEARAVAASVPLSEAWNPAVRRLESSCAPPSLP